MNRRTAFAVQSLWARGAIAGCSVTPCRPGGPVTRDAMARFPGNAFALRLDGPWRAAPSPSRLFRSDYRAAAALVAAPRPRRSSFFCASRRHADSFSARA